VLHKRERRWRGCGQTSDADRERGKGQRL
jgi:hypothetical protein